VKPKITARKEQPHGEGIEISNVAGGLQVCNGTFLHYKQDMQGGKPVYKKNANELYMWYDCSTKKWNVGPGRSSSNGIYLQSDATTEDVTTGLPWTNMVDNKKTAVCLRRQGPQQLSTQNLPAGKVGVVKYKIGTFYYVDDGKGEHYYRGPQEELEVRPAAVICVCSVPARGLLALTAAAAAANAR